MQLKMRGLERDHGWHDVAEVSIGKPQRTSELKRPSTAVCLVDDVHGGDIYIETSGKLHNNYLINIIFTREEIKGMFIAAFGKMELEKILSKNFK